MPNEREMNILIRAKETASKAIDKLEKSLDRLNRVMEKLDKSAESANKLFKGLKTMMGLLATIGAKVFKVFYVLPAVFGALAVAFGAMKKTGIAAFFGVLSDKLILARGAMVAKLGIVNKLTVGVKTLGKVVWAGIVAFMKLASVVLIPIMAIWTGIRILSSFYKEMKALDKMAKGLGISFDELSVAVYGVRIPREQYNELKRYSELWADLGRRIQGAVLLVKAGAAKGIMENVPGMTFASLLRPMFGPVADILGDIVDKAWKDKLALLDPKTKSQEWIKVYKDLERQLEVITKTGVERRLLLIDHEMDTLKAMYGDNAEALERIEKLGAAKRDRERKNRILAESAVLESVYRAEGSILKAEEEVWRRRRIMAYEYSDAMGKLIDLLTEKELAAFKLRQWGIRSHYDYMSNLQQTFGTSTISLFENVFVDAWNNKLQNAREIFSNFLTDLQRAMARWLASEIVRQFIMMMVSAGASGAGAGGSSSSIGSGAGVSAHAQYGGEVKRTGMAVVHQGERIKSPYSQDKGEGANYNVTINAVDAGSFVNLLNRNPEAIVAIVDRSIRLNQPYRRTVREQR